MPWRTLVEVARYMDSRVNMSVVICSAQDYNIGIREHDSITIHSIPKGLPCLVSYLKENKVDVLYYPVAFRDTYKPLDLLYHINCKKIAYIPGGIYSTKGIAAFCYLAGIKFAKPYILEKIIPYLDQIYCDLKIFDDDKHLACTGVHNDIIKENIRFLLESGKKEAVTVRTPLIPRFTATKKNIGDISIFISKCYNDVKYEILNYNPLAKAKYSYLDMQYCFESNPKLYTAEQMQEFYSTAESSGIKNLIIE